MFRPGRAPQTTTEILSGRNLFKGLELNLNAPSGLTSAKTILFGFLCRLTNRAQGS